MEFPSFLGPGHRFLACRLLENFSGVWFLIKVRKNKLPSRNAPIFWPIQQQFLGKKEFVYSYIIYAILCTVDFDIFPILQEKDKNNWKFIKVLNRSPKYNPVYTWKSNLKLAVKNFQSESRKNYLLFKKFSLNCEPACRFRFWEHSFNRNIFVQGLKNNKTLCNIKVFTGHVAFSFEANRI